jgi:hypothetical protein
LFAIVDRTRRPVTPTPAPPDGIISDYITRQEAASEAGLFPVDPPNQLKGCWLQPGGNLPAFVAQSFGLVQNGLAFSGSTGQRTVKRRIAFAPQSLTHTASVSST